MNKLWRCMNDSVAYKEAISRKELQGVLKLQSRNLSHNLPKSEQDQQGFVSLSHSLELLEEFMLYTPQVIAVAQEQVVGYVLGMTKNSRKQFPSLEPMFVTFDHVKFKGKHIAQWNYVICGQACIEKQYRGKGILRNLYNKTKSLMAHTYDFCVTAVSDKNQRSLMAHQKIGFQKVHTYTIGNHLWHIIIWDWKQT